MTDRYEIKDTDAFIVVDMQNDFCPDGALPVPEGDKVVPVINGLMPKFEITVFTQDWHPKGHQSFASSHEGKEPFETIKLEYGEQVLWPDHCVQGSEGAKFHEDLKMKPGQLIIRKGFRKHIDSYSAFYENDQKTPTGLAGYLRERGVKRVFLAGLALDFCVGWSAEDAAKEGFEVVVIEDGTRGIDTDGSIAKTLDVFEKRGVARTTSDAIA